MNHERERQGAVGNIPLLDAHLHLIDPRVLQYRWLHGRLRSPHTSAEFAPIRRAITVRAGGHSSVFVQADAIPADGLAEVDWVSQHASDAGVVAVVAHVSLDDAESARATLDALATRPLVVGVRQLLQSMPDELWLSAPYIRSVRDLRELGYSFDACVRADQLPALSGFVDRVPGVPVVLDHLGKPLIAGDVRLAELRQTAWARQLVELGKRPTTTVKLSGLPAEVRGHWSAHQLLPYLDVALEAFGPDRLMFGSDWPVSGDGTADSYARWWEFVLSWALDRLGGEGARRVMNETASWFYRVPA